MLALTLMLVAKLMGEQRGESGEKPPSSRRSPCPPIQLPLPLLLLLQVPLKLKLKLKLRSPVWSLEASVWEGE